MPWLFARTRKNHQLVTKTWRQLAKVWFFPSHVPVGGTFICRKKLPAVIHDKASFRPPDMVRRLLSCTNQKCEILIVYSFWIGPRSRQRAGVTQGLDHTSFAGQLSNPIRQIVCKCYSHSLQLTTSESNYGTLNFLLTFIVLHWRLPKRGKQVPLQSRWYTLY